MLKHDRPLVLAATAAGVVLAAVLTLLQASVYRADASIALVRQGQPPGDDPALAKAAEATAELVHSRAVAEPAIANLRLDENPDKLLDRVEIETDAQSSLVRVVVEAPSAEEARRTAQELAEISTVLFNDRFGPQTAATIWEPARAEDGRVSPKPARNLALGALVGALAGWTIAFPGWAIAFRRRPKPQPAPRERQPVEPEPESESEPTPVAEPEATAPFVLPSRGEWTVADVERLIAEHGDDSVDEFGYYVESFRLVAAPDGRLPPGVEFLLEDVFAELIARASKERT